MDTTAPRPPSSDRRLAWAVTLVILVAIAAAAAGWWWWASRVSPVPGATAPTAAPPTPSASPAPPTQAQAPAPDGEPVPEPPAPAQPLAATELASALEAVLGRDAVLRLLQTTDLPRYVVATVDNLARGSAPASVWPVNPAAGRFAVVEQADGSLRIDPDNMQRYTPLVLLAERVDAQQLAAWYRRALPVLQQAYEELGYPGGRFHARLVAVLDHLLATPVPAQPPVLRLTEVRGPVPSAEPWRRYEFADPALEEASAGRKILWRVGPVHQRRLMKVLAGFRDAIRAEPPR